MPRPSSVAFLAIFALFAASATIAAHEHDGPPTVKGKTIPLIDGLGNYHRAITTSSAEAQAYFDQGMMLAYAFGRREAVISFRTAAE